MEIKEYLANLKEKYHYSDEMIQFLEKAIPAMITHYKEDKKDIVLSALKDCEIHIQEENEKPEEYLNQYFGEEEKLDIPFLGGAFHYTKIVVQGQNICSKSIIYIPTKLLFKYKPFDFKDDKNQSTLVHEICHGIKGYNKLRIENGQLINSSGLIKDYYEYDKKTNSFHIVKSENTGLEEALNSYDEASIMTIMTGVYHEHGAYPGMTVVARELMKHEDLETVIRTSQFGIGNEWQEYLGIENSEYLSTNFDEWINILYSSPAEMMDERLGLFEKMQKATNNVYEFAKNYSTPEEIQKFQASRLLADQKTAEKIKQSISSFDKESDSIEELLIDDLKQSL